MPSYLDHPKAKQACRFFESLTLIGDYSGEQWKLEAFQRDWISELYGTRNPDGTRQKSTVSLWMPRGLGKALDVSTPIPTPDGWTTMGALQIGDTVFSETGEPTKVVSVSEIMLNHECFRVEFSDRTHVIADADHLWTTESPDRKPRTLTTKEIGESLYRGKPRLLKTRGTTSFCQEYAHRLPSVGPLDLPDVDLPVPPYTLGVWLGDGDNQGAAFTCHKDDMLIRDEMETEGHPAGSCRFSSKSETTMRYRMGSQVETGIPLQTSIRKLGLLNNKHIPAVYLRASYAQRLALLQGLMDTDGTCGKTGGRCEFDNMNVVLARGVLELVRSLGIKAFFTSKPATLDGRVVGIAYRVSFQPSLSTVGPVFRLPRKWQRQSHSPGLGQCRKITSVVPVSSRPVKCIQVDTESHLYLAGEGMVPTHNSQQAAGVALYELCMGQDGREVYAAAPDREKAGRIYKAMAQMIRANPYLNELCICSDHYMRIKVPSKHSTFHSLAANEGQGNSLAPSTLVCDEMHLWKSRNLYDALVSGGHKRKEGSFLQIQISTAGNTKSGLAWELYSYAKKVRDGVIVNPNFLVRIFETPEEADWTAEETWRLAMPCSYVNFKTIAEECEIAKHIKHKEYSFRQLYLGHWLEHQAETWINLEDWHACAETYTEEALLNENCILALDMSSVNDLTSVVLYFPMSKRILTWSFLPSEGIAKRSERDKVDYQTWAKEGYLILTKGKKIDHQEVAEKINELLTSFKVDQFVADPALLSLINPHLDREPDTYKQTYEYLHPPCQKLELLISDKKIHHNNNPLLNWCAGNVVVVKDKQDRLMPAKRKSRNRIDPVVALLMAIGVSMGDEEVDFNTIWENVENFQIDVTNHN